MTIKHTFWIILAAVLFSAGCKDEDTTPPTAIIETPANGDTLYTGDTMELVATLSDDRDLLNYTAVVRIKEEPLAGNVLSAFQFGNTYQLFATTITDTQQIGIPEANASGTYQLEVQASDRYSNESGLQIHEVVILNGNDHQNPAFSISTLDENQNNTFQPGEDLVVDGSASDNEELGGIQIIIREMDNTLVSIQEFQLQTTGTNFNYTLQAPSTAGNYNMVITVADNANNQVKKYFTIEVQ